jgi:transposase
MTSKTTNKFSPEVRARAVRMVLDHKGEHPSPWAAVSWIAAKIGCSAHTLNEWVKAEVDSGKRAGLPSDVAEKMKALERENRELRQANEILRKASAYFAMAELDRRHKPRKTLGWKTPAETPDQFLRRLYGRCCDDRLNLPNMSRSAIPSVWRRLGSNRPSVASG